MRESSESFWKSGYIAMVIVLGYDELQRKSVGCCWRSRFWMML